MCKELCAEFEEMQSCPDCGKLICFDAGEVDDVIVRAAATSSGDLYCFRHAAEHDRAEEEAMEEECHPYWEDDVP